MLRAALVVVSLIFGTEINADSTALAGLPYQNCNEAHADGRYSIPISDPAHRPDLVSTATVSPASHLRGADRHGESLDGLACR